MNDFITRFHAQAHGREILSAEQQLRIAINLLQEASARPRSTPAEIAELISWLRFQGIVEASQAADLIEALASVGVRLERELAEARTVLRKIADMFGNEDRSYRECCEPAFNYFNPSVARP
jgi:hypothetical protein